MAQAVSEGVHDAGFEAELFRVPETLPDVVIDKMGAKSFQAEFQKLRSFPSLKDQRHTKIYEALMTPDIQHSSGLASGIADFSQHRAFSP